MKDIYRDLDTALNKAHFGQYEDAIFFLIAVIKKQQQQMDNLRMEVDKCNRV